MTPDIEKALTLVYEIEGLLHLLQHRNINDMPISVKKLLEIKSTALKEMLTAGTDSQETKETDTFEIKNPLPEIKKETETTGDDTERLAENVEYEQEEDSAPDAGTPDGYQTKLDIAQAEEDEADTESVQIDDARYKYYGEIAQKRSAGNIILHRFTINDRYRFTRELFGGSTTAFTTIIEEISTFATIDKVREYLTEKQGMDLEHGAGKDFINIIATFFQQ